MRDKADAWQMEIASITWEFEKITKNLETTEINFQPDPNSWSIAENLSHLIQLNSSYYPIFDQILLGIYKTPFLGKFPFVARPMGRFLYQAMGSKTKTKTFAIGQPSVEALREDIVTDFRDHQMEFSAYIQKLEPHFGKGTIIHSPVNRLIVYELDQAIDIIIAHEKRHLNQCRNILLHIPAN